MKQGTPLQLSGVGFAEGGHRVRRDGARLGGEDTRSPDRVPLWNDTCLHCLRWDTCLHCLRWDTCLRCLRAQKNLPV